MHSAHRTQLVLQRLGTLTTPPAVVLRMLQLSTLPTPSLDLLSQIVRTDPGLAVQVLRTRPASERRRRNAIGLSSALTALGTQGLRELVLRAKIEDAFAPVEVGAGAVGLLLASPHAIACAAVARRIAEQLDYADAENAAAAGLLSSIGLLALCELFPEEMREIRLRITGQSVARLLEVEREVLGVDHEKLAMALADAWALPYMLHDVLSGLYRSAEQVERLADSGVDSKLVSIVRAARRVAHVAGFPLLGSLQPEPDEADVGEVLAGCQAETLLEAAREAVAIAGQLVLEGGANAERELPVLRRTVGEVRERLVLAEQKLRAEESVNSVLQYGLRRLGDGDPLPGVMFHAMESIGFMRICCLEIETSTEKLEVRLSSASSGFSRVPERTWIPFPAEPGFLGAASIISRADHVPAHQLVLELVGVTSAVVAPLREIEPGRRWYLCADRGPAGHSPIAGEERALGIIADQLSLLLRYEKLARDKERMATQDPLTGAATRRRLMDRLDYLIAQGERTRLPFSVLLMDLDHFKRFNDTMGHQTGDRLLQDLVHVLDQNVRKGDLVARYGGEEFVVLLPNCPIEGAERVAQELRSCVYDYGRKNIETYDGLQVSISIGAAEWAPGETALSVIGRADTALYAAKANGRNCVMRASAA